MTRKAMIILLGVALAAAGVVAGFLPIYASTNCGSAFSEDSAGFLSDTSASCQQARSDGLRTAWVLIVVGGVLVIGGASLGILNPYAVTTVADEDEDELPPPASD